MYIRKLLSPHVVYNYIIRLVILNKTILRSFPLTRQILEVFFFFFLMDWGKTS